MIQTALQKPHSSPAKSQAVDAQSADGIADEITEERVFVIRAKGFFTFFRVRRG
jgi:hypothetical protein